MAAVSKAKFGRSLKARLDALSCPYSEGTEEDWIVELVFKPGEPRIRLLQWIFSKYDSALGEMVDNPQSAILGSKMDSRMQRLLFVASNLGLCRYDDVDLIRGVESSATSIFNKQVKFMDRLLDIVTIQDTAEDPMTKSLLHAGVISDASPLEEQVVADCRLMDALVSKQLPNTMLTHSVDLIPHDIRRLMQQHDSKEGLGDVPTLYKLTDMCSNIERNLTRRMEILEEMQDVKSEDSSRLHRASHSLDLVLGDLSQLVVSFTYTYENEMLPWCHRAPLHFSQLGPAFRRVHALITKFAQMLQGLHQIRQSYQRLRGGVEDKLKANTTRSALLVEIGQAAVTSFQDCVDILENSVQHEQPSLPITSNLCSATLRL